MLTIINVHVLLDILEILVQMQYIMIRRMVYYFNLYNYKVIINLLKELYY